MEKEQEELTREVDLVNIGEVFRQPKVVPMGMDYVWSPQEPISLQQTNRVLLDIRLAIITNFLMGHRQLVHMSQRLQG